MICCESSQQTDLSTLTWQVGSRLIWQVLGVILMLFGVLGKFGALMAMIPDPVIGTTVSILNCRMKNALPFSDTEKSCVFGSG